MALTWSPVQNFCRLKVVLYLLYLSWSVVEISHRQRKALETGGVEVSLPPHSSWGGGGLEHAPPPRKIQKKSVHTNACNKQSDECYLSYCQVHGARCNGYPRGHNFGPVLILSPTCCTEGYQLHTLFPSKLQEYIPPPYSRLSTQYHTDPMLSCFSLPQYEGYSMSESVITAEYKVRQQAYCTLFIYILAHLRENWAQK